jgi:hypothetical protein
LLQISILKTLAEAYAPHAPRSSILDRPFTARRWSSGARDSAGRCCRRCERLSAADAHWDVRADGTAVQVAARPGRARGRAAQLFPLMERGGVLATPSPARRPHRIVAQTQSEGSRPSPHRFSLASGVSHLGRCGGVNRSPIRFASDPQRSGPRRQPCAWSVLDAVVACRVGTTCGRRACALTSAANWAASSSTSDTCYATVAAQRVRCARRSACA